MAEYLFEQVRLFVSVVNVSMDPNSIFLGAARGGNLAPPQFQLPRGAQQATQGAISVPNAVLGAQGTFPLEQTVWDIRPTEGPVSRVILDGTVTYVTVEDIFETVTTQTINVTLKIFPTQVPVTTEHLKLEDEGIPSALLTMGILAGGRFNQVAADKKDDQAAATNGEPITMKRVITQKKEKDPGDKV